MRKQLSKDKPQGVRQEIEKIRIDIQDTLFKKRFIFAGCTMVCALSVFLFMNSLNKDRLEPVSAPPPTPAKEQARATSPVAPEALDLPEPLVNKQPPEVSPAAISENLSFSSAASDEFQLSGILYDAQKPLAIINNSVVGIGDQVNGAKVLEIQADCVRLSPSRGRALTLKLQ